MPHAAPAGRALSRGRGLPPPPGPPTETGLRPEPHAGACGGPVPHAAPAGRALSRGRGLPPPPGPPTETGLRPEPHAGACGGPVPHAAPAGRALSRGRGLPPPPGPPTETGLRPEPHAGLVGAPCPTPPPRAAHCRAAAACRLRPGRQLRRGYAPNPTRGLVGAPCPTPPPRAAHCRAAWPVPDGPTQPGLRPEPHATTAGRALSRGLGRSRTALLSRGYAPLLPNPTRGLVGAPCPTPPPRAAHCRAAWPVPDGPTQPGLRPEPHATTAGRALSRGLGRSRTALLSRGYAPNLTSVGALPHSPARRSQGPDAGIAPLLARRALSRALLPLRGDPSGPSQDPASHRERRCAGSTRHGEGACKQHVTEPQRR